MLTEILVNTDSNKLRTDKYVRILSPPNLRPKYSGIVTICVRERGSGEGMPRSKQINRQMRESRTCGVCVYEIESDCESLGMWRSVKHCVSIINIFINSTDIAGKNRGFVVLISPQKRHKLGQRSMQEPTGHKLPNGEIERGVNTFQKFIS